MLPEAGKLPSNAERLLVAESTKPTTGLEPATSLGVSDGT
jgi:hypothetical protein